MITGEQLYNEYARLKSNQSGEWSMPWNDVPGPKKNIWHGLAEYMNIQLGGVSIPGSTIAELEKHAILKTMEHVKGSTSQAAKILGISVRKIQYRLRSWRSAATVVLLLALWPSAASATNLAFGVRCQEGWTSTTTPDLCLHHDVELDVVVGGQLLGIQLTGEPGQLVAVGGGTIGVKLVYKPRGFALPEMVGAVLTIAGSLFNTSQSVADEGFDGRFDGAVVLGVTALGFWYGGVGPYFVIENKKWSTEAFLSTGFTIPL